MVVKAVVRLISRTPTISSTGVPPVSSRVIPGGCCCDVATHSMFIIIILSAQSGSLIDRRTKRVYPRRPLLAP